MDHSIKILVVGSAGVGKTSLCDRFTNEKFSTAYRPTVGGLFSLIWSILLKSIFKIWWILFCNNTSRIPFEVLFWVTRREDICLAVGHWRPRTIYWHDVRVLQKRRFLFGHIRLDQSGFVCAVCQMEARFGQQIRIRRWIELSVSIDWK